MRWRGQPQHGANTLRPAMSRHEHAQNGGVGEIERFKVEDHDGRRAFESRAQLVAQLVAGVLVSTRTSASGHHIALVNGALQRTTPRSRGGRSAGTPQSTDANGT